MTEKIKIEVHDNIDSSFLPEKYRYLLASKNICSRDVLLEIPEKDRLYKCHTCHTGSIKHESLKDGACPICGETHLMIQCPIDHCSCDHEFVERISFCILCGEGICPICGCHDVVQISRVTGYLQEVKGFNEGKRAELKDRHRVNIS